MFAVENFAFCKLLFVSAVNCKHFDVISLHNHIDLQDKCQIASWLRIYIWPGMGFLLHST